MAAVGADLIPLESVFEILPDERRQGFVVRRHAIHRHPLSRVHQALKVCRRDAS
jgi:hypothetical protein